MILLLLLPLAAGAQKTMTLDEAIMVALENNYSLKINRNDQAMAENNVTLAPFLPTVTGQTSILPVLPLTGSCLTDWECLLPTAASRSCWP